MGARALIFLKKFADTGLILPAVLAQALGSVHQAGYKIQYHFKLLFISLDIQVDENILGDSIDIHSVIIKVENVYGFLPGVKAYV